MRTTTLVGLGLLLASGAALGQQLQMGTSQGLLRSAAPLGTLFGWGFGIRSCTATPLPVATQFDESS